MQGMPHAKDEKEFCPQGLSQRNWVHLFAAMAKYESDFNPKLTYLEKFENSRGERILSTGLLQISYEQARHSDYGYPTVTTEQLKDPKTNLDIGVKIMRRLIKRDGVVSGYANKKWIGGAAAWSVLRTTGKLSAVKAYMKNWCE